MIQSVLGLRRSQLLALLLLFVVAMLSGCSNPTSSGLIRLVSSTSEVLAASEATHTSVSSNGEWVMEGYSPRRDRATTTNILPPLKLAQAFTIGDQTQLGSPVTVAGGLLLAEGHHSLHAYNLDTGEARWSADLPGSFVSPAVVGNRIFVRAEAGEEGYVLVLDAASGQRLWYFKFPRVGSDYGNIGGHVTSPVVINGLLLVGASESFRALEAETGQEVWVFQADEPITSAAAATHDTVFFTDFSTLHALDLTTGTERWRFEPENGSIAQLFAPVISADEVITTSGDTAYALNRYTGEVLWRKTLASARLIPAGASGDQVYVKSTERLYALERTTGADLWSFQAANFVSLPAIAGEQIYIVTRAGGTAQLRALNRTDGQEIWQIENAQLSNAAPVVAGNRVYVRTVDGGVLAYD